MVRSGLRSMHQSAEREQRHQHDVERQHVEVERLELQDQPLEDRLDRIVDQAGDIELVDDLRLVPALRDEADRGDIDDEQQNVRDVELPDALQEPRRADQEAALQHDLGVHKRGGVAGDEDEQVRGVAEAVVADRQPVHDVVRNVIEEDPPVGDSPEQIEAKVAAAGRQNGLDAHDNGPIERRSNGREAHITPLPNIVRAGRTEYTESTGGGFHSIIAGR